MMFKDTTRHPFPDPAVQAEEFMVPAVHHCPFIGDHCSPQRSPEGDLGSIS